MNSGEIMRQQAGGPIRVCSGRTGGKVFITVGGYQVGGKNSKADMRKLNAHKLAGPSCAGRHRPITGIATCRPPRKRRQWSRKASFSNSASAGSRLRRVFAPAALCALSQRQRPCRQSISRSGDPGRARFGRLYRGEPRRSWTSSVRCPSQLATSTRTTQHTA